MMRLSIGRSNQASSVSVSSNTGRVGAGDGDSPRSPQTGSDTHSAAGDEVFWDDEEGGGRGAGRGRRLSVGSDARGTGGAGVLAVDLDHAGMSNNKSSVSPGRKRSSGSPGRTISLGGDATV